MTKEEAIQEYATAVLCMLRCTSIVSTSTFIDSVNRVLKARNQLLKYDVTPDEAMKSCLKPSPGP